MSIFKDLYKELAEKISTGIETVKWVDLWHDQINFLEDEHPFPTPAVFLSFRVKDVEDLSQKIQLQDLQIDVYLFFETFTNTFHGGVNQDTALNFLDTLDELFKLLHGTEGEHYASMRRIAGTRPVSTGNAGNLYVTPFECVERDARAGDVIEDVDQNMELCLEKNEDGAWFKIELD